jgi:glycosyltransferase 2 family protein
LVRNPKILVGFAISVACGYIAVRGVNWSMVWAMLTQVRFSLLIPALVCLAFLFLLRAYRWQRLVEPIQVLPFGPFFSATLIGFMANDLLPLRLGELVRAYTLSRLTTVRVSTALATAVLERVWDALMISVLLICVLWWVPLPVWLVRVSVTTLGGCAIVLCLAWWLARRAHGSGPAWLPPRLTSLWAHFVDGLQALRGIQSVVWLACVSLLMWLTLVAYYWLMFHACGLPLSGAAALAVTVFTVFAVALPAAPGFIGTFQYATVLALALFAVPREEALGFSIVAHVAQVLPVVAAGFVALVRSGLPLWPSRLVPVSDRLTRDSGDKVSASSEARVHSP